MVYGASFENWWAKVRMGSNPIPSAFLTSSPTSITILIRIVRWFMNFRQLVEVGC